MFGKIVEATSAAEFRKGDVMRRGILYIAFGYEYLLMAANSAATAKVTNPDLGCAVITNIPVAKSKEVTSIFDHINVIDSTGGAGMFMKTDAVNLSPFEYTLLLDCDTEVWGSLNPMFECLNRYDLVLKINPKPTHLDYQIDENLPGFLFPQWNSGAIFFKKSTDIVDLFADWRAQFIEMEGRSDQPSLAAALYRNPGIRVLSVTVIWNTFPAELKLMKFGKAQFKSRIFHYRFPGEFPKIAERIYTVHRRFLSESALVSALSGREIQEVEKKYSIFTSLFYKRKITRKMFKRLRRVLWAGRGDSLERVRARDGKAFPVISADHVR